MITAGGDEALERLLDRWWLRLAALLLSGGHLEQRGSGDAWRPADRVDAETIVWRHDLALPRIGLRCVIEKRNSCAKLRDQFWTY